MNRSKLLVLIPAASFAVLGLCSSNSYAEDTYNEMICGPMTNISGTYATGPFDYRNTKQKTKDLVENYHFNYQEKIMGSSKERDRRHVWNQFEYTLKIFPNSPRALAAIDRLSQLIGQDKPPGARFSAECAFLRAEQFAPDDPIVRVLHGFYLGKRGRPTEAVTQLDAANRLAPDSPSVQYNLGLAYFQIKDYTHAREHAAVAYDMGYPLPGLREMLKRVGYWEVNTGPGKNLPPVSAVSAQERTPRNDPVGTLRKIETPPALER